MFRKIDDWLIVLDFAGNTIEDDKFSVSTLIEKANRNVGMFLMVGLFYQGVILLFLFF